MGYRSSNACKAVGEVKRCFIGKEVHPEQVRVQAEQVPQNKNSCIGLTVLQLLAASVVVQYNITQGMKARFENVPNNTEHVTN